MKLADLDYSLRAALYRLGRVGGLGLALLGGAALFHFSTVRPAQQDFAELQHRLDRLEHRDSTGRAARPHAGSARMDEFMDFFPALDSAPQWLSTVYSMAEGEKLELLQGTYKLTEDPAFMLSHYRISLPVRGSYPQVRRFIARVLDAVPFASLEGITFQRESASTGAIEANVALTLHLRAAPKAVLPVPAAQITRLESAAPGSP